MHNSLNAFYELLQREVRTRDNPAGKVTVLELGKVSGISNPQIYAYLNREQEPGLGQAERLLQALGHLLSDITGPAHEHGILECYRRVGEELKKKGIA